MFTREITTEIDIAARPERVWTVLTAFSQYEEWNPAMVHGMGEPREGQQLTLRFRPAMPGGKAMTITPRVLSAEPNRLLRWRGRLLTPGIFTGVHEFLLTPTESGTHLKNSEHFSGVLIPFMGGLISRTREQFEELNVALKQRAEKTA